MPNNPHARCRTLSVAGTLTACILALAPSVFASGAEAPPAKSAALYEEGMKSLSGDGVPKDGQKALERIKSAADAGYPDALAMMGVLSASGTAVPRDDRQARGYFEKAAEAGSLIGKANLGLFLVKGRGGTQDTARGIEFLEAAAEAGNLESSVALAELYYFGEHDFGQKPDYVGAHAAALPAAHGGIASAQNMVGVILKDGRLGKPDPEGARAWFERAAYQGDGKACFNLCEIWNPQSDNRQARIEALRWLIVGKDLGETMACYHFEDIKPGLAKDELGAAEELAKVTNALIQDIKRRRSKTNS